MYQIFIAKPIDSLIFLPLGSPESFRTQKKDPRGMAEMYRIDCNWKTYRFADFRPIWASGNFSEPKLGSERKVKNVKDCNCKTYRFVDFPIVRVSGSFSEPKIGSERYVRNVLDF